jgi:hypothetical protein
LRHKGDAPGSDSADAKPERGERAHGLTAAVVGMKNLKTLATELVAKAQFSPQPAPAKSKHFKTLLLRSHFEGAALGTND